MTEEEEEEEEKEEEVVEEERATLQLGAGRSFWSSLQPIYKQLSSCT